MVLVVAGSNYPVRVARPLEFLGGFGMTDLKIMRKAAQHFKDVGGPVMQVDTDTVLELIDRVEATEKKLKSGHAWCVEVKKQTHDLIDEHDKIQKNQRALLKEAHAALDGYVESDEMLNHIDAEVLRDKIEAALK